MPRILIVEDEPIVADLLQEYVTELGFIAETVSDGKQAVDRASVAPPDLIIMDLMLPQLNGGEAAQLLRQDPATAAIPIVAITGIDQPEQLVDVLPFDAMLQKPFDLVDLEQHLRSLIPGVGQSGFQETTQMKAERTTGAGGRRPGSGT